MTRLLLALAITTIGAATNATAQGILYGAGARNTTNAGAFLEIDELSGLDTVIGPGVNPHGMSGLAVSNSGALFATTARGFGRTSSLVMIDASTGAIASTIRADLGVSIGDLAYDPITGDLYGMRSNGDGGDGGGELFRINTISGDITLVGDTGSGAGGGIAFTADGRLFQSAYNNRNDFFSLNELSTADASRVSTTELSAYFDGLTIRADGTFFATGAGNDSGLYTIDAITGTSTLIGSGSTGLADIAFGRQGQPVPEPATVLLLGFGLAGAAFRRRLRQR